MSHTAASRKSDIISLFSMMFIKKNLLGLFCRKSFLMMKKVITQL